MEQPNQRPVVDFGVLRTNGMMLPTRHDQGWILYSESQPASSTLTLDSTFFPPPAEVFCQSGTTASSVKPQLQAKSWTFQPIANCTSYRW